MTDDEFYEDDEPIEKIEAILARGPAGVTWPPPNNFTWSVEHGLQRVALTETLGWAYVRPVLHRPA